MRILLKSLKKTFTSITLVGFIQYLIFGFVTCLFTMYVTTSYFLTLADTSLFNMSLLTADFYIAILFIYLFHGTISVEYIFAFICIAIGLFIYGKEPLRA